MQSTYLLSLVLFIVLSICDAKLFRVKSHQNRNLQKLHVDPVCGSDKTYRSANVIQPNRRWKAGGTSTQPISTSFIPVGMNVCVMKCTTSEYCPAGFTCSPLPGDTTNVCTMAKPVGAKASCAEPTVDKDLLTAATMECPVGSYCDKQHKACITPPSGSTTLGGIKCPSTHKQIITKNLNTAKHPVRDPVARETRPAQFALESLTCVPYCLTHDDCYDSADETTFKVELAAACVKNVCVTTMKKDQTSSEDYVIECGVIGKECPGGSVCGEVGGKFRCVSVYLKDDRKIEEAQVLAAAATATN